MQKTTIESKPKLRGNLQVSQIDASTYELLDPETEACMTLDSVGFLVAEQFELGDATVEEVRLRLREDQRLDLPRKVFVAFLLKASRLGFLEEEYNEAEIEDIGGKTESFEIEGYQAASDDVDLLEKKASVPRFLNKRTLYFYACIFSLFLFPVRKSLSVPAILEAGTTVEVRAQVEGVVQEVLVQEGDSVKKGSPLMILTGFQHDIVRLKSEIGKLKAEYNWLDTGPTAEELNQGKRKVKVFEGRFEKQNEKVKRLKDLLARGLVSEETLKEEEDSLSIKEAELAEAKAELNSLRAGTREEKLKAKQYELRALEVDLKYLEEKQEKSIIRSSVSGTVISENLETLKGKLVRPGEFLVEVSDFSKMRVLMFFEQNELREISTDKGFAFKAEALPKETFESKIDRIAPVAQSFQYSFTLPQRRYVRAYGTIDNSKLELTSGMTGIAHFSGAMSTFGLLWFKKAFVWLRMKFVL